jgi:hypothetical protein
MHATPRDNKKQYIPWQFTRVTPSDKMNQSQLEIAIPEQYVKSIFTPKVD